MEFEQFYLGCLAQASYLVGADGECAIVDPRRDVDLYLEAARERGLAIRHVILTHLHADFVAGHCELARRAGATIWISEHAHAEFEHRAATDGEELRVGGLRLVFLATPGHTPESMTVLVYDPAVSEEQPQKMLNMGRCGAQQGEKVDETAWIVANGLGALGRVAACKHNLKGNDNRRPVMQGNGTCKQAPLSH